jgi:hypothetical protein
MLRNASLNAGAGPSISRVTSPAVIPKFASKHAAR